MRTKNVRRLRPLVTMGLFALALGFAPSAWAEDGDSACADDMASFCGNAGPSHATKSQCLKSHMQELSDGCKALLGEPEQRRTEAGDACGDDAVRVCAGVEPGRNNTGMLNCLRANAASLSDACRNAIDALPGKKREGAPPGV
jgi:hypothetical protein